MRYWQEIRFGEKRKVEDDKEKAESTDEVDDFIFQRIHELEFNATQT